LATIPSSSYFYRFSPRLKPRWYTEMSIWFWLSILLFVLNAFGLFYNIVNLHFLYILLHAFNAFTLCYTTLLCFFLAMLKGICEDTMFKGPIQNAI
jgi:hypothetical protein